MPQIDPVNTIPVNTASVRAAISRAAQQTNTNFDYLLAQARIESGLNPAARSPVSSAAGLYQFVNRTWQSTLARHGAAHGLDLAGDPSRRAEMMALRFDPQTAATMAGELANDNRDALRGSIGREPGSTDLYLAHFLGAGGAASLINAIDADPAQPAAALLPEAARSNRAIFFELGGAPRSVGEVYGLIDARMQRALAVGGAQPGLSAPSESPLSLPSPDASTSPPGGPIAREWAASQAALPSRSSRSMAETLRATFGSSEPSSDSGAPATVRTAYARFQALGL